MLFDLRGRGRRRTVQVIYVCLALLLGGGLVLFGIGGDVQGGLFDAFRDGNTSATEQAREEVEKAQKRTQANPSDPAAWGALARAEFRLAGQSEGFVPPAPDGTSEAQFTGASRTHLERAQQAWQKHLQVAGEDKADPNLAAVMRNALSALGDDAAAVRAQELVIDRRGNDVGFGDYAQLAVLAYQADQIRKGDLAAERAKKLAPENRKKELEAQLASEKARIQSEAAGGAQPGAAQPGGAADGGAGQLPGG